MIERIFSKPLLLSIYVASLLYSFGYALPLYINSSFLHTFIPAEAAVGLVFTAGAILSIICILLLPRILQRFGNYKTTLTAIILAVGTFLALASAIHPYLVITAFIVNQALLNVIYLNLNAFLETFSGDETTGELRGAFLTVVNTSILVAPILGGFLLTTSTEYGRLYLAAAVFMIGIGLLMVRRMQSYKDPLYTTFSFWKTFGIVRKNHDLHAIIVIQFLLNFFYAWMTIYTPIYLHTHIGIPMSDILTIIIPVALIPFVVLQFILGTIADKKLGEKEILVAGLMVMAVSTAFLSFITVASVIVWALALMATRIGACAVEVMAESYFYKQIDAGDVHLITFMYIIRTGAVIVGPLLGSLALVFFDYHTLFILLGGVALLSIPFGLHFKDSR